MKFRANLTLDLEIPDERALERYGSIDPYAVAAAMTHEAPKIAEETEQGTMELIACTVVPRLG